MRPSAALLAVVLVAGACGAEAPDADADEGRYTVRTDTVDPALLAPGVILRTGSVPEEALAGPLHPPVVRGDVGQISIYEGLFIPAPCSTPLQVAATRGDTITVRVRSEPDSAAPTPCPDGPKAIGYAMLVGQFDPGTYAVRLIHNGDGARPAPLDTVYNDITISGH